jgi:hypothetical protein
MFEGGGGSGSLPGSMVVLVVAIPALSEYLKREL